jgi:hypothetical protein
MTARVFDFPHQSVMPAPDARQRHSRIAGLKPSALVAMLVVPVAGAGEAPTGWVVAGLTAASILLLAMVFGRHIRWGWVGLAAGGLGLALPRGTSGIVGPPLFVATLVCLILWHAHSKEHRRGADRSQKAVSERTARFATGLSGERQVGRLLAGELPQDYTLINALKLPRGAGDIDHLVVGPTGLFVLETKTMQGQIICQPDGSWQRTRTGRGGTSYPAYIGNPAIQVQRNIFAVRQTLRRRLPDLVQRTSLWIEGLVVFAHPKSELRTAASRVPAVLLNDTTTRICKHAPRHRLQPIEVDAIVQALLQEAQPPRVRLGRWNGQALVELAVLLPVVLFLVFGAIGVSRYVQTRAAVVAVAHEAARAGALAISSSDAVERMRRRTSLVAPGLGLDSRVLLLNWDLSQFGNQPGQVEVTIEYPVDYGDLPLVGGLFPAVVRAEHTEWVDPFRSGIAPQPGSGN